MENLQKHFLIITTDGNINNVYASNIEEAIQTLKKELGVTRLVIMKIKEYN